MQFTKSQLLTVVDRTQPLRSIEPPSFQHKQIASFFHVAAHLNYADINLFTIRRQMRIA